MPDSSITNTALILTNNQRINLMIDINKLLEKEPTLTAFGIERPGRKHTDKLPNPTEIANCIKWLETKTLKPTKTTSFCSSCIKVRVEQEYKTYVSHGAVVAALIYLGIPYDKTPGHPNVEVFLGIKGLLR